MTDKLTKLLDRFDEVTRAATPGPWKYIYVDGSEIDDPDKSAISTWRACAEAMSAVVRAAIKLDGEHMSDCVLEIFEYIDLPEPCDCGAQELHEALTRLAEVELP